jgi:hypothetical protein
MTTSDSLRKDRIRQVPPKSTRKSPETAKTHSPEQQQRFVRRMTLLSNPEPREVFLEHKSIEVRYSSRPLIRPGAKACNQVRMPDLIESCEHRNRMRPFFRLMKEERRIEVGKVKMNGPQEPRFENCSRTSTMNDSHRQRNPTRRLIFLMKEYKCTNGLK